MATPTGSHQGTCCLKEEGEGTAGVRPARDSCVSRQQEGTGPPGPQTPGPVLLPCGPPHPAIWALALDVPCCLQEAAVACFPEDSTGVSGQSWREEWPLKLRPSPFLKGKAVARSASSRTRSCLVLSRSSSFPVLLFSLRHPSLHFRKSLVSCLRLG